ncbi:hypothetical protein HDF24_17550 [Mucilaginibacter sp. X4EP1]|jgi:hypothetical protein|uniref:hypothetical protein n=1 Tax=Mucilaginibacter sp. X4EP1 TaxID=2723092 RepID=UPI0021690B6F|nr:hypothetical protein [Mucilaginibacter sp. X4EP1]MCS3815703.1 hypothetical protein [Mucilaginibacter sp. X4EP1]
MSQLNFINNSTDQNNAHIVILVTDSTSKLAVASHFLSLASGAKSGIQVAEIAKFYVSIISPEVAFDGGIVTIKEHSAPAVEIKADQTAVVSGDLKSGYQLTVN